MAITKWHKSWHQKENNTKNDQKEMTQNRIMERKMIQKENGTQRYKSKGYKRKEQNGGKKMT